MWSLVQVWCTPKMILNYRDRSNRVLSMTKTKLENYVIDCIDMVHVENETDLSWLIEPGTVSKKPR